MRHWLRLQYQVHATDGADGASQRIHSRNIPMPSGSLAAAVKPVTLRGKELT
jgi:hypothetical protein